MKIFFQIFALQFFSIYCIAQVNFESSNLPIILIDSELESIPDEPKVIANMGIIYNGEGQRNFITNTPNHYNGQIGIEIRGASSQSLFPKKGYGLETRDENGENNNVELLGMPAENDWILHGPFSDKSLMRNALTYKLAGSMMDYAPRIRFVELVLNAEYLGVYLLTEKIKRDKNRVDIQKNTFESEDITGGYMLKIDKSVGVNNDGWTSAHTPINSTGQSIFFQLHYPAPNDITNEQFNYIQNYINDFETLLKDSDYRNPNTGYRQYIDVQSFIDFLLINELTRNVDGYRLSTFMYKDSDEDGGLLHMGPVWDFNLALGNADYCRGGETQGWAYNFNTYCSNDFWLIPFWWQRLLQDDWFLLEIKNRWEHLRQHQLSNNRITASIDSLTNELEEAQVRNFEQWPILNEWIWPNVNVGGSHSSELWYLKNWIDGRLSWMDNNIADFERGSYNAFDFFQPKIYPNPFNEELIFEYYVRASQPVYINIYDVQGRLVEQILDNNHNNGAVTYIWKNDLPVGMYFYTIQIDDNELLTGKVFKY